MSTMIAALVSTPLTGDAEAERREKLRALRADGWIPAEGEEKDGSPETPRNHPRPKTLPIRIVSVRNLRETRGHACHVRRHRRRHRGHRVAPLPA